MGSHGPFVSYCGQDSFGKQVSGGEEETYFATKCAVRRYILKPKLTNRRENPDTALSVDAEEWPSGVSATVRRL